MPLGPRSISVLSISVLSIYYLLSTVDCRLSTIEISSKLETYNGTETISIYLYLPLSTYLSTRSRRTLFQLSCPSRPATSRGNPSKYPSQCNSTEMMLSRADLTTWAGTYRVLYFVHVLNLSSTSIHLHQGNAASPTNIQTTFSPPSTRTLFSFLSKCAFSPTHEKFRSEYLRRHAERTYAQTSKAA